MTFKKIIYRYLYYRYVSPYVSLSDDYLEVLHFSTQCCIYISNNSALVLTNLHKLQIYSDFNFKLNVVNV